MKLKGKRRTKIWRFQSYLMCASYISRQLKTNVLKCPTALYPAMHSPRFAEIYSLKQACTLDKRTTLPLYTPIPRSNPPLGEEPTQQVNSRLGLTTVLFSATCLSKNFEEPYSTPAGQTPIPGIGNNDDEDDNQGQAASVVNGFSYGSSRGLNGVLLAIVPLHLVV